MTAIERNGKRVKTNQAVSGDQSAIVAVPEVNDLNLAAPLRDAAVAGVVLNFNPRDAEMRERASHAWSVIRSSLARHLLEDRGLIPAMSDQLRKRYFELRGLARQINSVSFEDARRDEIALAGKALCALAVQLDDLINRTEHKVLSKLRTHVFANACDEGLREQLAV